MNSDRTLNVTFAKRHCVGGGRSVVAPLISSVLIVSVLLVRFAAAKQCPQIDVRNSASDLMQLENCTVITGSLTIVLIENDNSTTFEKYTFPQLK